MWPVKSVQQHYMPGPEIQGMLDEFRQMMNACVQVGLVENVTSLKALSLKAYKQLASYDAMSYYKLCAVSGATGILRNHRKASRHGERPTIPFVRRLRLTTCYGFKIRDGCLLLPHHRRELLRIPLTSHTQAIIARHEVRSVTLTQDKLSLSYAKQVTMIKPNGFIGIDRNLNNVTTATTDFRVAQHDLSEATRIKSTYRSVKRGMVRNDHRIRKRIFGKYGVKERNRVQQILQHASKTIVEEAKLNQHCIVMEILTGIRKLYRKGNLQTHNYRARLNGWSFAELQRQIEYKARWKGL